MTVTKKKTGFFLTDHLKINFFVDKTATEKENRPAEIK